LTLEQKKEQGRGNKHKTGSLEKRPKEKGIQGGKEGLARR